MKKSIGKKKKIFHFTIDKSPQVCYNKNVQRDRKEMISMTVKFFMEHEQDSNKEVIQTLKQILQNDSRFCQLAQKMGEYDMELAAEKAAIYMTDTGRNDWYIDDFDWFGVSEMEQLRELVLSWALHEQRYDDEDGDVIRIEDVIRLTRLVYTIFQ
jgi:hypothetical protein